MDSLQQPATPALGDPTPFGHLHSHLLASHNSKRVPTAKLASHLTIGHIHTHKAGGLTFGLLYRDQSTRELLDLVRLPEQRKTGTFPPSIELQK